MERITREEVDRIAALARIDLAPEEVDRFVPQLEEILSMIDTLAEVDVEGVAPFLSAADEGNVFREDRAGPTLDRAEALREAPEADDAFFLVPRVTGD